MYGDLDEEIFMNFPKRLDGATNEDPPKLQKYIYGLVEGARQYHKEMIEMLKKLHLNVVMWIHTYTREEKKTDLCNSLCGKQLSVGK